MDDLTLVRALADDTPLPTPTDLAPARARLMAALTAATTPAATTAAQPAGSRTAVTPLRSGKRRKRGFVLAGGSTLVAAAAVAVAVTLTPVDVVGGPAPAVAGAAEVLNHAAAKARTEPFVEPRPDQFVYYRSTVGGEAAERWVSVDGTRDGAVEFPDHRVPLPGCRDGVRQVHKGPDPLPGVTEPCEPDPAYKRDLPTTADAMLAYLDANASGGPGNVNARGKDVMGLAGSLLKPDSKAALFEAAAKVEGLEVVRDTRDTTGRPAVGIEWPAPVAPGDKPRKTTLYFDPATYEYLGTSYGPAEKLSIVDEVGQRP
ncbi:CU044_5270 family protein [Saccharothrix sp. NPDC042600]|uniref:CU044_5270 family protein n=1 Tax=Saccharothrix TaxID=2071 RepID=UPI0033DC6E47|nr:CU044_5270 family protein [Saccharothrix mutabilis subsp. capreolus]